MKLEDKASHVRNIYETCSKHTLRGSHERIWTSRNKLLMKNWEKERNSYKKTAEIGRSFIGCSLYYLGLWESFVVPRLAKFFSLRSCGTYLVYFKTNPSLWMWSSRMRNIQLFSNIQLNRDYLAAMSSERRYQYSTAFRTRSILKEYILNFNLCGPPLHCSNIYNVVFKSGIQNFLLRQ